MPHAPGRSSSAAIAAVVLATHLACGRAAEVPEVGSWRPLPETLPRALPVTAWTGKELLVWGGEVPGVCHPTGRCRSGARYDPERNIWVAMDEGGAPSTRSRVAAAWTGKRLFVWGGDDFDSDASLGDGGLYDPTTNTWEAIPAGGPPPRQQASAVWTGGRILLWGGVSRAGHADTHLADGWSFDPESKAWSPISGDAAPSPRLYPSTVWTGERWFIWGGQKGDASFATLGDGAVYDPGSDRWQPISTQGALSPRWAVAGAAVGSRVALWGGLGCGGEGACTDGAFYDPRTDRWQAIDHRASTRVFGVAWTGRLVLVWSGNPAPGWVHDPATDRWSKMSPPPPKFEPRDGAILAWTGRELLVWGGMEDYLSFGDGAAYVPPP